MNEPRAAQDASDRAADIPDAGAPAAMRVVKHSIVIAGHRTSISLEDAFWRALKDVAARQGCSLAALVARIDAARGAANLSSALRVFVLEQVAARAATQD